MRVALSLGSNLGDRVGNLERALDALKSAGVEIISRSGFYETTPWGSVSDQPMFINMAAVCETSLGPNELFRKAKEIEKALGREPAERWGPRLIDIDILIYGSLVINTPELVIPHPHMHEREFVLEPLCEIAPSIVHPVSGLSAREMLDALREKTG